MNDNIEKLINIWIRWIKNNQLSMNRDLSFDVRKKAALKCQELISQRYKIINNINEIIDEIAVGSNKVAL